MTNVDLLQEKIKASGIPMTVISAKTGINRATIYNKLRNRGEFTASEIVSLSSVLHLSKPERDKIFLSQSVN